MHLKNRRKRLRERLSEWNEAVKSALSRGNDKAEASKFSKTWENSPVEAVELKLQCAVIDAFHLKAQLEYWVKRKRIDTQHQVGHQSAL